MTEGKNIEADLITMSSFYIDSAQEKNNMFLDLDFPQKTLEQYPSYYTPITAQEGALIVNTEMMKENNLPTPKSIKDLANPEYNVSLKKQKKQGLPHMAVSRLPSFW